MAQVGELTRRGAEASDPHTGGVFCPLAATSQVRGSRATLMKSLLLFSQSYTFTISVEVAANDN